MTDEDEKANWMLAVGDRIRVARVMAGMTQVELGEKTGISSAFIREVEKGSDLSLVRFWRIADALGESPVFLLTGEPR